MKHEQTILGQAPSNNEWRTIPCYEKYQMNRNKEIRAFYKYKGSCLSPHYSLIDTKENNVTLSKDGKKVRFCVDYLYELCFGVEHVESLQGEFWIPIREYEGYYKISNMGRVLSERKFILRKNGTKQFAKEQIVKPKPINSGYDIIVLHKNGRQKKFLVHRLVAEHYINNPLGYDCVNHKDENKRNNRCENLEWCTRSYNQTYGTSESRRIATRLKNNNGKYGYKRKENR